MGSGKRNYRALRLSGKKGKKYPSVSVEEKKEPPKEEDVKGLLELWQKNKAEKKDGE